jgi:sulfide:quinone oxidoreductase
MGKIFSQDDYAKVLNDIAKSKGIAVNLNTNLAAIRPESREAVFHRDGKEEVVKYDFLHVTPPMSAPKFIADSGLGNAQGYVDVDQYTMQHNKYKNVFSLGDASSLPTSKTAAAVSAQAGILYKNLLAYMGDSSAPLLNRYDGYTGKSGRFR